MTDAEFTEHDELAAIEAYRLWQEAARRNHPSAQSRRDDYERLRGDDD